MKNRIKVQHYVPRFYLRRFSVEGKEGYLYCFDKLESRKFVVRDKNVACESYFYDTPKDADLEIEQMFSWFESKFHVKSDELAATQDLGCLDYNVKEWMAYFIAMQHLRTKESRKYFRESLERHKKGLSSKKRYEEFVDQLKSGKRMIEYFPKECEAFWEKIYEGAKQIPSDRKGYEEWANSFLLRIRRLSVDAPRAFHILLMLECVPTFAEILCKRHWRILVNRTRVPYWSSDHPVSIYSSADMRPRFDFLDVLMPDSEIYFPLTPTISIWICDPIISNSLPSNYEIGDIRNVKFQNSLQVLSSTRYIFSNQNDFSLAEDLTRHCALLMSSPASGFGANKPLQREGK